MTDRAILEKLNTIFTSERVLTMESMAKHTTFRVGGPAQYFVSPGSVEEIRQVLKLSKEQNIPLYVVGNGSNLLVMDGGIQGIVLHLGERFREMHVDGCRLTVQAGALLSQVARKALEQGLTGFEFAAGIPGSIGGAVVMNAGAYDGEMKQVVKKVVCMTYEGELLEFSGEEMQFSYRHSVLKDTPMIALEVTVELTPGDPEKIKIKMDELSKRRIEKQPLEYPSAGSTFKRPEGYFAGKLIMDAGFAGVRVGDAMISAKHCGFLVNAGEASARDILELISQVQKKVKGLYQVELEPEIIMLGEKSEG